MEKRYALLFFLIIVFYSVQLQGQESNNDVENVFATVENRIVDDLSFVSTSQVYNLPIGIKRTVGNIPYTLAITSVKFGQQYAEASLLLKMQIPQKSQTLILGATGVKMSFSGDLVDGTKLSLLSSVPIPLGNLGQLILKGGINEDSGQFLSDTYVVLDCNGDFKEMSIDGEVMLNSNTFKSCAENAANDSIVKGAFRTSLTDWNDLLVEVSFPKFELKALQGFEFEVFNAVLDLSDIHNSPQFIFPSGYKESGYFTFPEDNLWRGLYINDFSLTLPRYFKNSQTNTPTTIKGNELIIDDNGITLDLKVNNILPIEAGSADGWPFSVSDFRLSLLANNIKGFGFGGELQIPIGDGLQLRKYEAFVSNNQYLFNVELGKELNFNLYNLSKLHIEPTSYLQMRVVDDQFIPSLSMDGSMTLNTGLLKMEQVTFEKLTISTRAPYLTVRSMGYGGTVGLNGFPITISDLNFRADNDVAELRFDAKLDLMEGAKISADTRVTVASSYKNKKWNFQGVSIEKIALKNIELAGFSLNGEINLMKNDPVYGDGFGGRIRASFDAFSDGLVVDVKSIFGSKDFRYWYVEGAAEFPGIPVGGGVFINGFTGGAYYRMRATGKEGLAAYVPSKSSGLGVKAGASLYIAQKNTINANALLEMSFLQTGGVHYIKFFAQANFLEGMSGPKTPQIFASMQKSMTDMGSSLMNGLPSGADGSNLSKGIVEKFGGDMQNQNDGGGIKAYATMEYDFPSKTFDANFRAKVNIAGGLVRGINAGGEAGEAHLHISPQKWFVKVGTPSRPIGLKMGLGSIALTTSSYIMFGDIDESPLPPPDALLNKFGSIRNSEDFMNFPRDLGEGKGVAFGSRMGFDTGELKFLIMYARFEAGTGYDVMFRDMAGYTCKGSNGQIGINNWYAMGQCYAYLQGKLGVRVKILFVKKDITIISGGAAALLQASLPNPAWIGGRLAVNLNILGIIKGSMDMKMSFGEECEIVKIKDDKEMPLDFPIISDMSPADGATDIDVFALPQVTFCKSLAENIVITNDGNRQTFRIKLENFYATDDKGIRIEGKHIWNNNYDAVSFESKDILPPDANLKVYVSVIFEEYKNGNWSICQDDGQPAREERSISFKTGDAPNYIPLNNVEGMYPIIGQKNMYQKETSNGYVQLKRGQSYLFPNGFNYNVVFETKNGQPSSSSPFKYDSHNMNLQFLLPNLNNNQRYDVKFMATSNKQPSQANESTITKDIQLTDDSNENFTLSYEQKLAQEISKDGGLNVLEYSIRTSQYNTLAEKMAAISFSIPDMRYVNEDVRSLILRTDKNYELFEELELVGSPYTNNKPLIEMEAVPTDRYYTEDIAPLIYNWYPLPNVSITKPELLVYGVPPLKAITLYNNYLSTVVNNTYDATISQTFPFVYDLPLYYSKHFSNLQTKAVNMAYNNNGSQQEYDVLISLIQGRFLFMRQGEYKIKLKYTLPNNTNGSSYELNYINTLDWR